MLFLIFISFLLNQNLNENYTSKSENQAVFLVDLDLTSKGEKKIEIIGPGYMHGFEDIGALLMIMR